MLPSVGYAKLAMEQTLTQADDQWLFPQYIKSGLCYATHASNAVDKWLKRDFGGLTAHSLRHTFRDRLRAAEVPLEIIDQLGGWSSVSSNGSKYGKGYFMEHIGQHMQKVAVKEL